ncbi:Holliday junction branch migration protein RuvA [Desulfopila sp. IMCC35008]|uniref:Holliday junction branch migration protein RuvA n=1 Tax=Desulfopila sp. IMCC35008 TaxID=2653858 RepID=UPI0013D2C34C|nr:Holliday junction branch migration protein RuvA [Desulfopila sp. IMCC35008]
MIATLSGRVQGVQSDRVIVDVSGVGYEVFLSTESVTRLPEKGGETFLHIHTHVREDAFILYGFLAEEEKELFLILKTVSGIGPKLALAMLSGMAVGELCRAIGEGDLKLLTTLQGVGKKTAERICVELKDKVGHLADGASGGDALSANPVVSGSAVMDALSALGNLGYSDPVAREALGSVKRQVGDEDFAKLTIEELIREGLKALA